MSDKPRLNAPDGHAVPSKPTLGVDQPPARTPRREVVSAAPGDQRVQGTIPARSRRGTSLERVSMRVLATGGIIGIATALGAVLVGNDIAGWVVGLAVGLASVSLAALSRSSRQL